MLHSWLSKDFNNDEKISRAFGSLAEWSFYQSLYSSAVPISVSREFYAYGGEADLERSACVASCAPAGALPGTIRRVATIGSFEPRKRLGRDVGAKHEKARKSPKGTSSILLCGT